MNDNVYLIPLAGLLALIFTYNRAQWVARQDPGTDRMKRIAGYITDGAMAFLRAEYSKLVWFVIAVALGAQSAFASPVAYQTHLLVYGPGGYRFTDFVKVGIPLNLICATIAITVIPRIWPF